MNIQNSSLGISALSLPLLQALLQCIILSKNATFFDLEEKQATSEASPRKYPVYGKPITFDHKKYFILGVHHPIYRIFPQKYSTNQIPRGLTFLISTNISFQKTLLMLMKNQLVLEDRVTLVHGSAGPVGHLSDFLQLL